MQTIPLPQKKAGTELATTNASGASDCVMLAQDDPTNLAATVLLKVDKGQIRPIDICAVPSPHDTYEPVKFRTNERTYCNQSKIQEHFIFK